MEVRMAPNVQKKYYFMVHTCDEKRAGTDAKIYITLYGEKGCSEEKKLNDYISGDAFEKNNYDYFSVPFDHDVGEVYKIRIHTDMGGHNPGWKCDYFHIGTRDFSKSSTGFSEFIISAWIEDSNHSYVYSATRGYPYEVKEYVKKYEVVQSGELIVPPGVTYEKEVVTSLTVQVEASSLVTTEIATGAQLHLDYSVVKADFEVRLNNTIQDTSSHKVGQVIQSTDRVGFSEPADKTRKYGVLWNEERYDYSINMGSLNFQFSIPTDRKFAGLKLLEEF